MCILGSLCPLSLFGPHRGRWAVDVTIARALSDLVIVSSPGDVQLPGAHMLQWYLLHRALIEFRAHLERHAVLLKLRADLWLSAPFAPHHLDHVDHTRRGQTNLAPAQL